MDSTDSTPDEESERADSGRTDRDRNGVRVRGLGSWLWGSYTGVVVLALVVGVIVAPVAVAVVWTGNSGTVAVVPVEGTIDGESAAALQATLTRLRNDPDVDAVVLLVNSPGGAASASESMYLDVSKTAETMPVVTSVDAIAASGAYYTAVGSDRIFVKPASLVGSVGVLFVPPPQVEPTDEIITTGPNKLAGASERGWYYKTEALKRAFVSAVVAGRGDALDAPPGEVATAELFTGAQSVENGMADEIGGTQDAVEYAAEQAGLDRYEVRVVRPEESVQFLTRTAYLASDAPDRSMVSATYFVGTADGNRFPNFLYLPPAVVADSMPEGGASNGTATPTGRWADD